MEWTADAIQQLRDMWGEGLSTAEIGRRFGVTKNAVVGKAHRLALPPRPSPIKRDRFSPPRLRPAKVAPTGMVTLASGLAPSKLALPPPEPPPPEPRTVCKPRVAHPCCWPVGEPRTHGFHFCDEPTPAGRSYCDTHHAVAYHRVVPARGIDPSEAADA